ncbi:MAG TPA: hypothetical protein VGI40_11470 [Pirellulaceae bacterium]
MAELTETDLIWNRACGDDPLRSTPGDRALADLLRAHGLTMNGGVLHAVECLTTSDLSNAQSGYRFFGLNAAASLLVYARAILDAGADLDFHERQLDQQYVSLVPCDSFIVERFEERLRSNPSAFSPLRPQDAG